MKLSILDQAPISPNQSAHAALNDSLKLAQAGEKWGYTRYWIAEHHSLQGLTCSSPEVVLGYIGAKTNTIGIGTGAILLPYYKPYKVAELANTLATLFPGRVDIGLGRAPGGSAEATTALSDHFLKEVWNMPLKVKELLQFLDGSFPANDPKSKVVVTPQPEIPPQPWLLGTNKKSAQLAAENGLPYAFGLFMSESNGREILNEYRHAFKPQKPGDQPQVILTVSAICAETGKEAEDLAVNHFISTDPRKAAVDQEEGKQKDSKEEIIMKLKNKKIIGSQSEVRVELENLYEHYPIEEIMVITNTNHFEDRLRSYQLLANHS